MANNNRTLFWTLSCFVIAIGLLFAFIGLLEFYNVKSSGGEFYPFGSINDTPWYYQTAETYTWYNFITGLVFLTVSLFTIWATVKKHKKLVINGVVLIILCCIADLISSKTLP